MSNEIRIYVADLAAYDSGHLHGMWIDACDDIGNIWEQIKTMLADSPIENSEEHAIHDYDGFGGYALTEYVGIEIALRLRHQPSGYCQSSSLTPQPLLFQNAEQQQKQRHKQHNPE